MYKQLKLFGKLGKPTKPADPRPTEFRRPPALANRPPMWRRGTLVLVP